MLTEDNFGENSSWLAKETCQAMVTSVWRQDSWAAKSAGPWWYLKLERASAISSRKIPFVRRNASIYSICRPVWWTECRPMIDRWLGSHIFDLVMYIERSNPSGLCMTPKLRQWWRHHPNMRRLAKRTSQLSKLNINQLKLFNSVVFIDDLVNMTTKSCNAIIGRCAPSCMPRIKPLLVRAAL